MTEIENLRSMHEETEVAVLGALVLAAAATAANGLQLGLEGFYFRKGRLLVIMDVNLEVIHEAIGCACAKSEFILGLNPWSLTYGL